MPVTPKSLLGYGLIYSSNIGTLTVRMRFWGVLGHMIVFSIWEALMIRIGFGVHYARIKSKEPSKSYPIVYISAFLSELLVALPVVLL